MSGGRRCKSTLGASPLRSGAKIDVFNNSMFEMTHARCDDGHAVLVAAVDCVGVADAAAWVGDSSHTSLHAATTDR